MTQPVQNKNTFFSLSSIAYVCVILVTLKWAQSLVLPLLLALFISILAIPFLMWLKSKQFSQLSSFVILLAVIGIVGFAVSQVIVGAAKDFSTNITFYESQLEQKGDFLNKQLQTIGIDLNKTHLNALVNPSKLLQVLSASLNQLANMLAQSVLIALLVIFMLLEANYLYAKIKRINQSSNQNIAQIKQFIQSVNKYMQIKTIVSFITGFLISIFLWFLKIHYPFLWGFLAFVLNFIPNIGSVLAMIPVILLAIIQFGFAKAVLVILVYVAINFLMGNIIEPKFMGKGLGLSPLVILLSLVFWGWMFGPIGMLLSVPLTMILKIGFEFGSGTKSLAILMSNDKA